MDKVTLSELLPRSCDKRTAFWTSSNNMRQRYPAAPHLRREVSVIARRFEVLYDMKVLNTMSTTETIALWPAELEASEGVQFVSAVVLCYCLPWVA